MYTFSKYLIFIMAAQNKLKYRATRLLRYVSATLSTPWHCRISANVRMGIEAPVNQGDVIMARALSHHIQLQNPLKRLSLHE